MDNSELQNKLFQMIRSQGVSLIGVGSAERFNGAPKGHSAEEIVAGARSVITFGIRIPYLASHWPELGMARDSEIMPSGIRSEILQDFFYRTVGYDFINEHLNQIALQVTNVLEDAGYRAIYFPATFGTAYRQYQEMIPGAGFGLFSVRHAAVLSGLAEFGLNNVAVTPQYGPRIRFNAVITTAAFPPTPLLKEKICLGEDCNRCVSECPSGSLTLLPASKEEIFWHSPPARTDVLRCRETRKVHYCTGKCIRICPVGK